MYILIFTALLFFSIFLPCIFFYFGGRIKKRGIYAIFLNIFLFILVFLGSSVFLFGGQIMGAEPGVGNDLNTGLAFIAAALVTGMGAIGTGIAVSSTAAAAIAAVSENEQNFGKSMIFVAMAEGIAIYGLLIAFMILGRV